MEEDKKKARVTFDEQVEKPVLDEPYYQAQEQPEQNKTAEELLHEAKETVAAEKLYHNWDNFYWINDSDDRTEALEQAAILAIQKASQQTASLQKQLEEQKSRIGKLESHLFKITEWFDAGCYVDDNAQIMIIEAQKALQSPPAV